MNGRVDVEAMSLEQDEKFDPRDARSALVSKFPFEVGNSVSDLFQVVLVFLVWVLSDGDRSNDDDAGVVTISIGEVAGNGDARVGKASVLEAVGVCKFGKHFITTNV